MLGAIAAKLSAVIQLHPLTAIEEVLPGDDLAALLAKAIRVTSLVPQRSDVLVVTQKIVSKAEGRFVELASVTPSPRAIELAEITRKDARFVELVLAESAAVVRAAPNVLITRHRSGHVMANAGIDRSNTGSRGEDRVLLLPADADASAQRLRAALHVHCPEPPAVLISDSFGRPWRLGVINVAIGASGLPALVDRRGETDRDGRQLEVTQVALGDMIATAGGLLTGEGDEGIPAVLVRGLRWEAQDRPASALLRPTEEDLFR
jgi:coenzyme F420-0:L-glutamate ligase/coenzyme F420-1:gamma-L-glutamate ligase